MGKHVLSNNITSTARQPYTKVTHEFYNAMINEAINALGQAVVNSLTDFTILYGCVNSASPNANITAGAIFYNGEIYLCDAFVDGAIANDIVGTITTTYDGADPVLFSNNSSYNVHQIKKIVWSDAVAGSGDIDFADLKNINTYGLNDNYSTGTIPLGNFDQAGIGFTINAATQSTYYYKIIGKKTLHFTFFLELDVTGWKYKDKGYFFAFNLPDSIQMAPACIPGGLARVFDANQTNRTQLLIQLGTNQNTLQLRPNGVESLQDPISGLGATLFGTIYIEGSVMINIQ